jgi:hypothetical protein
MAAAARLELTVVVEDVLPASITWMVLERAGGKCQRATAAEISLYAVIANERDRERGRGDAAARADAALAKDGVGVLIDEGNGAGRGDLRIGQRGGQGHRGAWTERIGRALGQADGRGGDRREGDAAQADFTEALAADGFAAGGELLDGGRVDRDVRGALVVDGSKVAGAGVRVVVGEVRRIGDGDGPGAVVARGDGSGAVGEGVGGQRGNGHRRAGFAGAGDGHAGVRVVPTLDKAAVVGRTVVSGGVELDLVGTEHRAGDAAELADIAAARLDRGVAEDDGDAPVIQDAGGDGGCVVAACARAVGVPRITGDAVVPGGHVNASGAGAADRAVVEEVEAVSVVDDAVAVHVGEEQTA